jgi:hypothetical protein
MVSDLKLEINAVAMYNRLTACPRASDRGPSAV